MRAAAGAASGGTCPWAVPLGFLAREQTGGFHGEERHERGLKACAPLWLQSAQSFHGLSNESMSLDERLPSFMIISFLSIVDTAGFINDGRTRPAFFQSSITCSPGSSALRVLLVIAMMITSDDISLCLVELMTTAGRFFDVR